MVATPINISDSNQQYARASYIRARIKEGWLLVGVVAQWQSTGMVRQRP